jgi:hypothetical protein
MKIDERQRTIAVLYQDIGACVTVEEAEAEIADAQERTPQELRKYFYDYILREPLGGFYWGWILR